MSSNLPPGCGRLPGEEDDGVTGLQETVLGLLEDETMLPTIINDHVIELIIFHEKTDPAPEHEYAAALSSRLRALAERIDRKYSIVAPSQPAPSPQPDRESEITEDMIDRGAKALFARAFPQADWDQAYAVDHKLSRDRAKAVLFAALTSSNRPQATEGKKP